ncbi:hypothetical protein DENSPDRAFT_815397 [Dentipellis sp. KUC8613]|nr:hypothetical protein DENSPDRAFT_815397 [Dentipellis sp. KUC8613]
MAHPTVLKENKRTPNNTPTSRPKNTRVRTFVALAICLVVLSIGNVVRLKFGRSRDAISGTTSKDSSPMVFSFSGWTAHPAMTLGLDDPMATIRSRKPSQERSGLLYALELESAQLIGRRDLSAVMSVTHETAEDLELILSTVQQESPGLVEVAIVCPQAILSPVRQTLQRTISSFPANAHLELSLHTWTLNMDEAEALISTASRLATGWILIIDHHHLRGLGAEERSKLFKPWSVSFPLGPRGFREIAPENKQCLAPSDSPQVASFLVPPFVVPAYVLNGDGISSQKSWPSLGSRIAASRPDSVGGVVLAITSGSGPLHNWCDTHHNGAQHILARHHSSDSNYHQRFLGSSLNPSPTKKDRGTFALILPTVDDMLYFSTASCRLISSGNRIHILLYAEEQEELGTENFDIDIGIAFEDGVISTDACDLRYQVSTVTDVAIDFIVTSWLDSLPQPPDIIIGATDEEKLTTYSFQGLKQKKHFYPTLIQLPRADLPYSDWMGVLSIEEWRHWNIPKVDVSIITDNRPGSLARLLDSITNARYFGDRLNLRVNMEQTADPDTLELIGNLDWNHGTVFVHHRVIHGGLLPSVVESWYPLSNDSYGLLLEDDVEASPLFYAWVKLTILRYRTPNLYGISLYQQKNVELRPEGRKPFNARQMFIVEEDVPANTPYLSQIPCSWGAVYFPEHWREFHTYLSIRLSEIAMSLKQDIVPDVRSNRWMRSWKKYFIELVYLRGYVMLYPNYANFLSLSTNHLEIGSHVKRLPRDIYDKKRALFTLPLLRLPDEVSSALPETGLLDLPDGRLPDWVALPVLDLHANLTSEMEIVRRGEDRWSTLMNCTTGLIPYDARSLFCIDRQLPSDMMCTTDPEVFGL